MIHGKAHVRLSRTGFWTHRSGIDVDTVILEPLFLRSENGIVSCKDGIYYVDTLVNFNLVPGQYWRIVFNANPIGGMRATVKDTSHIELLGRSLKRMEVEYRAIYNDGSLGYAWRDTILEQIGNLRDYILPWDGGRRAVDGGEGGKINCYEEYDESSIAFNGGSCALAVATSEPDKPIRINFAPNPFQEKLTITSEEGLHSISIFDLTGRLILQAEGKNAYEKRIDTSLLPPGLYCILVENEIGQKAMRKVVRQ